MQQTAPCAPSCEGRAEIHSPAFSLLLCQNTLQPASRGCQGSLRDMIVARAGGGLSGQQQDALEYSSSQFCTFSSLYFSSHDSSSATTALALLRNKIQEARSWLWEVCKGLSDGHNDCCRELQEKK